MAMSEMRLIDANALMKRIAHHTIHDSLKRITFEAANTYEQVKGDMFSLVQKAPIVDAVPVVRCRDCVHNEDEDVCPFVRVDRGENWFEIIKPHPDGFCHMGAKMDGGAEG